MDLTPGKAANLRAVGQREEAPEQGNVGDLESILVDGDTLLSISVLQRPQWLLGGRKLCER